MQPMLLLCVCLCVVLAKMPHFFSHSTGFYTNFFTSSKNVFFSHPLYTFWVWMTAFLVSCIQTTVCVYIFFYVLYFLFNRFGLGYFTPYYLCNSWCKRNKRTKNRKFMCGFFRQPDPPVSFSLSPPFMSCILFYLFTGKMGKHIKFRLSNYISTFFYYLLHSLVLLCTHLPPLWFQFSIGLSSAISLVFPFYKFSQTFDWTIKSFCL